MLNLTYLAELKAEVDAAHIALVQAENRLGAIVVYGDATTDAQRLLITEAAQAETRLLAAADAYAEYRAGTQ
jgi:hypothetical protein